MTKEPSRCELCGIKYAKYKCAACGREACTGCFWLQMGVCQKCAKK